MTRIEIIDLDGETGDKVLLTPLSRPAAKPHLQPALNPP